MPSPQVTGLSTVTHLSQVRPSFSSRLIQIQVTGAAVSAGTVHTTGSQSVPMSAQRRSPFVCLSVSWIFLKVSSQWDMPRTCLQGGVQEAFEAEGQATSVVSRLYVEEQQHL